jgi:hypothetical protein
MTLEYDPQGAIESLEQHVSFRLERLEQALLIFAADAGNNPTHAASELNRILRLPQSEFVDGALVRQASPQVWNPQAEPLA